MPNRIPAPRLAELWRQEIESYPVGTRRIEDGQKYFSRGAVKDLRGGVGYLSAQVQGSEVEPYAVEIQIEVIPPETWERIKNWLESNDWDKSELEQGRISTAFSMQLETAGVLLVPRKYKDIQTTCTCKDWMRPCKHILAVLFAFALEVDHDPLSLLRIRGAGDIDAAPPQAIAQPAADSDPLRAEYTSFWEAGAELEKISLELASAPLPRRMKYLARLGHLPFWGGSFDLHGMTRHIYDIVREKKSG